MRKLTFLMVILFTIVTQFHAQAFPFLPFPGETFAETAKSTMSSIVENTNSIYKTDMSESAFIDMALLEIPKGKRSKEIVDYFKRVHFYHKNGYAEADILTQENGKTLQALVDLAQKRGSAESAFFNDPNDPGIPAFRPFKWWLKLIIQLLSALANYL